jgi:hypothetical protein
VSEATRAPRCNAWCVSMQGTRRKSPVESPAHSRGR